MRKLTTNKAGVSRGIKCEETKLGPEQGVTENTIIRHKLNKLYSKSETMVTQITCEFE